MPMKMEELAPCGVDCTVCNIYRATAGLEELKQETIDSYTEIAPIHWRMDSLDPALLKCHGSVGQKGRNLSNFEKMNVLQNIL
jgi:hypothetical protein